MKCVGSVKDQFEGILTLRLQESGCGQVEHFLMKTTSLVCLCAYALHSAESEVRSLTKVGFGIPTIKVCNNVEIGLACSRATILDNLFYCVPVLVCIIRNFVSRMMNDIAKSWRYSNDVRSRKEQSINPHG